MKNLDVVSRDDFILALIAVVLPSSIYPFVCVCMCLCACVCVPMSVCFYACMYQCVNSLCESSNDMTSLLG